MGSAFLVFFFFSVDLFELVVCMCDRVCVGVRAGVQGN